MKRNITISFKLCCRIIGWWLFFLFLFPVLALAQAVQPCVVRQYNQQDAKTPLSGVQVEVRGAGTAVSDAQGAFTLNFTTLKPGDRVTTRNIVKENYELFNKSAVEQWTISRDNAPFQIVLVRSDYLAKLKNSLRQSSTENYKAKYEQASRLLREALEAKRLREEEYRQQMEELEDDYDNALRDLDNYIDRFARIDLSEVGAEEQRILEMVQQGRIDEAVKAYEELDLSGKLLQARENNRKLEEAKARIEEEQARQREEIRQLRLSLDREVATLKLAGSRENFEKIGLMLKMVALDDTTDLEAVWAYALFAFEQHDYKEAVRFYHICLSQCKDDLYQQSQIEGNMAEAYSQMGDYVHAEQYGLAALEVRMSLYKDNPDAYRHELQMSQNNLGLMYYNQHEYAKSELYLLAALENGKTLFAQDSAVYREELAMTLNNLGMLYTDTRDYTQAEEYYLSSLRHYTVLFTQDSVKYQYVKSSIHNNLGVLYMEMRKADRAEYHLFEALRHRTALYARNPKAYQVDLFAAHNNLGKLFVIKKDANAAEERYLIALEQAEALFERDSVTYRKDLAAVQNNLGAVYYALDEYEKAIPYFLSAVKHRSILFQQTPDAYAELLAVDQEMLGRLYHQLKDYSTAARWFASAIEKYALLPKQDEKKYYLKLVNAEVNLGDALRLDEQYAKARESYQTALEHLTLLYNRYPDSYHSAVARVNDKLGTTCVLLMDIPCAEQHYVAAAQEYAVLCKSKPDKFRDDLSQSCDMLNSIAYVYASENKDYKKAIAVIDQAIAASPDTPNYYDSKGEFLLMKGDAKSALKMWHKVLELDPEFLKKLEASGNTSELYKGLKAKGMVK